MEVQLKVLFPSWRIVTRNVTEQLVQKEPPSQYPSLFITTEMMKHKLYQLSSNSIASAQPGTAPREPVNFLVNGHQKFKLNKIYLESSSSQIASSFLLVTQRLFSILFSFLEGFLSRASPLYQHLSSSFISIVPCWNYQRIQIHFPDIS